MGNFVATLLGIVNLNTGGDVMQTPLWPGTHRQETNVVPAKAGTPFRD